jgi:hypothetical protein
VNNLKILLLVVIVVGLYFGVIGGIVAIPKYSEEYCARTALVYNIKDWNYKPSGFMNPDQCTFKYKNVFLTELKLQEAIFLDKMEKLP